MSAAQNVAARANHISPRLDSQVQNLLVKRQGEILAAVAMFTSPAVNLVYGVLVVRYLDPEMAGLISNASLLPVYLTFLHLGVLNGMQRELPYALGAGDNAKGNANSPIDHVGRLAGTVGALICVGAGLVCLITHGPPTGHCLFRILIWRLGPAR